MTTPASSNLQDKAKQRVRALDLIQKFAGVNAREGQKTKWIIELVVKVDDQYKQEVSQQQQQIVDLQKQLAALQEQSSSTEKQLRTQVGSLTAQLQNQEAALTSSAAALQVGQVQYSSMQQLLQCAEDAAAVAAAECEEMVGVVQALIDQESRVRNKHAHRALELREALQKTHAALRRAAADRVAQNERKVRLREREQSLAAERAQLLKQQSIHAAHNVALVTLQLKYHHSVCRIKDMLRDASQQADTGAAAVASGAYHPGKPDLLAPSPGWSDDTAASGLSSTYGSPPVPEPCQPGIKP